MHAHDELEVDFRRLTHEVFDAFRRQDREALEPVVAHDFRTTGGVPGNRMSRGEWMDLVAGDFKLQSFALADTASTIDGDTAIVSYRYSQTATYNHQQTPPEWFISDVWVRRDGNWQLLGRHYEVLRDEDRP